MRKRGFLLILTETLALLVEKRDWFFELLLQHIGISLISIALAALIGLSLGIAIATWRRGAKPVLALVNFVYTIPSIALFGFLIPITGIGDPTAIVALTVYALLPMVRNTYTGLTTIDPAIIEFIAHKEGKSIDEIMNILNKESGVYGLSNGFSSDFRDLEGRLPGRK